MIVPESSHDRFCSEKSSCKAPSSFLISESALSIWDLGKRVQDVKSSPFLSPWLFQSCNLREDACWNTELKCNQRTVTITKVQLGTWYVIMMGPPTREVVLQTLYRILGTFSENGNQIVFCRSVFYGTSTLRKSMAKVFSSFVPIVRNRGMRFMRCMHV